MERCNTVLVYTIFAIMMLGGSFAHAQYREESGALEQMYEARARTALNTVMRPSEYSVVIAVEIDQDPKRLSDVEEQMDKMSLPGIPGLNLSENVNVANKLHELKTKVDVHLVLDEALPKDKEDAARALVRMKLHLDESSGDTFVVARAPLVAKEAKVDADLLPELSWRMWALVLIVSLLGLGLALMWIQKKRGSTQEIDLRKSMAAGDEDGEGKKLPEEAAPVETEKPLEGSADEDLINAELIELYERKKSLTELATKYPEAASKALAEQFEKGHQEELMTVCEAIGWETAKALFSGLGHRIWGRVGVLLTTRNKKPTTAELLKAVEFCHHAVIAKYLELTDGDASNPFGFLLKLSPEDQGALLKDESPFNLAAICVFIDDHQKSELLERLPDDLQQAVLLEISRLREIPYESVRSCVSKLRDRLKSMKENPSVQFDGQKYLLDLLRQLDVESEQKFLDKLGREEPTEIENLRQNYLMFADLAFIPGEFISESIGGVDLKTVTIALSGPEIDLRAHILAALPEKRAKMIEKDISYLKDVSRKDMLAARRVVVKSVQTIMAMNGKNPGFYISSANADVIDMKGAA